MNEEELYEKIKNKKACYLFEELSRQLDLLPPNGAKIHKLRTCRQIFISHISLYSDNLFPADETIAEYKQRDSSNFENTLKKILDSVNDFKILL
ncbi:Uncharacterised protein [uncultured archaeon]|nr:Uncharacterised protein [uncultured archaeon]